MKTIKRIIKTQLVNLNIKPVKVVILPTGIICEHFKNGKVKVILEQVNYTTRTEKGMILEMFVKIMT